jgi:hypothetical protein
MIDFIMENVNNKRYGTTFLDVAGPKAIGRAFNRYFGFEDEKPIQRGIYEI